MIGKGNPAPRPGASLQQLPPGVPQPFQQGVHGPGRPVMQHLSNQSGSQVYQNAMMPPHSHIQQVTQSGTPNIGLYGHGPQHNIGSNQSPYKYPPVQHNSQHPPQLGVQHLYHVPLPRSNLPPPPPCPPASHGFQCSELLIPPPPPSGYIMHRGVSQPTQPTGHQGLLHIQPPQLPPLASALHRSNHSELFSLSTPNDSQKVSTSPPPLLLHSFQPPFPPACPPSGLPGSDGKELTSAVVIAATESPSVLPSSVGCTDPVKMNGVCADKEPTFTFHSKDSSETVDCIYNESETCVSMVNGSLPMDNKSEFLRPEAGSSSQRNSSTGSALCSTSDSDMDMEDDIVNLVEDLETNDSQKDRNHENRTQGENLHAKEQLNGQSPTPESFSDLSGEDSSCPIKVLQGFASDDSTEKSCAKNVNDVLYTLPAIDEAASLEKVGEPNLASDGGSNNNCTAVEESNPVSLEHSLISKQATAFGKEIETDPKNKFPNFVAVCKPAELPKRDGSKEYLCDESQHASQVKGRLKPDDMTSKHGKSCVEDATASLQLKVDEFGRLAKDVSSDSDSDDFHYSRKRGRRGRSRSISPFGRRKTPVRRRHNRSRSRSRSPLRRRSRSRSPGYRHPTESISERRKRDKIQTSVCFNFRDGRCYRGASCRFLHDDSDKSGSSNSYKRKPLSEAAHGDKGSKFQEKSKGSLGEMGSHRDDKDKSHGSHKLSSTNDVRPDSGRDNNVADKNGVGHMTVVDRAQLDRDDNIMVSYIYKCEDIGGETARVVEASMARVAQDQDATNLPGYDKYQKSAQTCHPYDANSLVSLVNSSAVLSSKEPLGSNPAAVLQYADLQPQKSNISNESISVQHQSLGTPQFTTCDPRQKGVPSSSLSYALAGSRIQPVLSENPSSRVPSSVTGTPFSQAMIGNYMPQLQSNFSVMQTSTGLPLPFMPGGGPSNSQFSLPNQPPQSSLRPIPLWTSLPPPLPRASIYANTPNANNSSSGNTIPYQFEWNQQTQRTAVALQNISRSYSGQVHYNSQCGGNLHDNYHPSVEAQQPSTAISVQRPDSLFVVNPQTQQTEGLQYERNDQTIVQGLIPSTFHGQLTTSFISLPAIKPLPSSETVDVSSQSDHILKNTSLNDPRNSVPSDSGIIGLSGKIESSSFRTSSANPDVSGISEFGPRTSVHCNMYASNSDHPLASMLSQPQMMGAQEARGFRERSPSSISIRNAGQNFPGSGGGQYDPLLDSLDKSSNSLVNSERFKKQHSTSDSDNMIRGIMSCKPLDVEETNRKKESEAIASLTSSDNEEFGETADAEVGALENESFSNPVDMPNRDSQVAISETFPDKKSKDSRSMKLFKSAIANFVKDLLKPSWRQGSMSKEAFKTIVKKTVEKVSGAMKGHRYPKSRAKINHYIDTSERKLTKLVMGYVDKYVKV